MDKIQCQIYYAPKDRTNVKRVMLDNDDLGPADKALLDLLNEGRITAPYASKETGYNLQYVRDRLSRFVEHGHVKKLYEGLYELVNDPRKDENKR